ncbi:MAG: TRAP transporter small permease [Deltaproteobacteria bacterium]|nr:MAG: TRAP transporter small permease [Deltaproteobacteria bacterium]
MEFLEKVSRLLNQGLLWIAGCLLAVMIILTCGNIFCRVVWVPIRGTFELMGYLGAVITAFALGYTQIRRGHISVDIVVLGFPKKIQGLLNGINGILCGAFFSMIGWEVAKYAGNLRSTGEVTETLRIIYYPFTYAVALGCFSLTLVFLVEVLRSFSGKQGESA